MQIALTTPHWSLTNLPPLIPLEFLAVAQRAKMSALIDGCDGSVFHHAWDISSGKPIPAISHRDCLAQFVPASRGLKGTELQKLFTCGPDLIHDLDAAGLLQVERERAAAVGPRASRLYTRASIVQFLESRFMGDSRHN